MEPRSLRFLYWGRRRRYRRMGLGLRSGGAERTRSLLLLLLLELLLVLLGDRGHRRRAGLETLLLRGLSELLLRHPRRLWLEAGVAGVLLLQWSLAKAGGLRSERTRLLRLLRLLLLLLASSHAERVPILLGPRAHAIAAEIRVRVGVHDY